MNKYLTFLMAELPKYFLIKIGIICLLAITLAASFEVSSGIMRLNQTKTELEKNIGKGDVLRPLYHTLDNHEAVKPKLVINQLEKNLGSKARFYSFPGSILSPDLSLFSSQENVEINGQEFKIPNVLQINEAMEQDLKLPTAEKLYPIEDESLLPIFLGADYKDTYNLGDEIILPWILGMDVDEKTEKVTNHNKNQKYVVTEFLDQGTSVMDFVQESGNELKLDKYFLIPLSDEQINTANGLQSDLNAYFFRHDKQTEKTTPYEIGQELAKIADQSGYRGLFLQNDRFQFTSKQVIYETELKDSLLKFDLLAAFIVLQVYVIIGLLLQKQKRTYQIFYTLGSTKGQIAAGLLVAFSLIFLLAGCVFYIADTYYFKTYLINYQGNMILPIGSCYLFFMGIVVTNIYFKLLREKGD